MMSLASMSWRRIYGLNPFTFLITPVYSLVPAKWKLPFMEQSIILSWQRGKSRWVLVTGNSPAVAVLLHVSKHFLDLHPTSQFHV